MMYKFNFISALFLFNSFIFLCQAQNLNLLIKERSGTTTSFDLKSVSCLTFKDHTITVRKSDRNESNYALSDIQFLTFGTSTGLASIEGGQYDKIKLFPNPVSKLLTCEFTINKLDDVVLHIFGLDGKNIFQKKYLTVSGLNRITIPVSFLQNGIYYIRIQNSEMNKTFKFIKCN